MHVVDLWLLKAMQVMQDKLPMESVPALPKGADLPPPWVLLLAIFRRRHRCSWHQDTRPSRATGLPSAFALAFGLGSTS